MRPNVLAGHSLTPSAFWMYSSSPAPSFPDSTMMNGTCSARRKKEAQTVENIIGGELQRRDAVDLPDRFRCRVQTIGMVVVAEILRGEAGGRRPCGGTKG